MHVRDEKPFLKNTIILPLLILIPFLLFILLWEGSYIFDVILDGLKEWDFDVIINHNRFTLLNRQANEMYDYAYKKIIFCNIRLWRYPRRSSHFKKKMHDPIKKDSSSLLFT